MTGVNGGKDFGHIEKFKDLWMKKKKKKIENSHL